MIASRGAEPTLRTARSPAAAGALAVLLALAGGASSRASSPADRTRFELPAEAAERLERVAVIDPQSRRAVWWERIDFGPFRVEGIGRGWAKSEADYFSAGGRRWNHLFRDWPAFADGGRAWTWRLGPPDGPAGSAADFRFELWERAFTAWEGQCGTDLGAGFESVSCGLRRTSDGKLWVLAMGEGGARPAPDWLPPRFAAGALSGWLSDGRNAIEAVEIRHAAGRAGRTRGPAGYLFARGGRLSSALDLVSRPEGAVWLPREGWEGEERSVLAAAAAALKLRRRLRQEGP